MHETSNIFALKLEEINSVKIQSRFLRIFAKSNFWKTKPQNDEILWILVPKTLARFYLENFYFWVFWSRVRIVTWPQNSETTLVSFSNWKRIFSILVFSTNSWMRLFGWFLNNMRNWLVCRLDFIEAKPWRFENNWIQSIWFDSI